MQSGKLRVHFQLAEKYVCSYGKFDIIRFYENIAGKRYGNGCVISCSLGK